MENGKERYAAFKQRAAGFLQRNGFTVVLGLCVLVIGIAAAATLSPQEPAATPLPSPTIPAQAAAQSGDERLAQALATATPAATPAPTPAPAAAAKAPTKAAPPVEGEILWGYAMDQLIYSVTLEQWTTHPGVDLAAKAGSEVRCVLGGTVKRVYADDALGVSVLIDHGGGRESLYANLAEHPPVQEGQKVAAADVIGLVGDTATSECMLESHLHFGFLVDGAPRDPAQYVLLGK